MVSKQLIPQPTTVIVPQDNPFDLRWRELWAYRGYFYHMVWRDVRIRYTQTIIGVLWAVIAPILNMLIYTAVFGLFARVPSDGIPYPVFIYSALVIWTYFGAALGGVMNSLVGNSALLQKIYFPRLLIPAAAIINPTIDFLISLGTLFVLMIAFSQPIPLRVLLLPMYFGLTALMALAFGLWLAAIQVRYRDVGHMLPYVTRIWMYTSPIIYPLSLIPQDFQPYYMLNPLSVVIQGFRWCLFDGQQAPPLIPSLISVGLLVALTYGGAVFFRKMEGTFADVV